MRYCRASCRRDAYKLQRIPASAGRALSDTVQRRPGQALRNQESIQNALSIMNLEADLHDLVEGIF
jgi:hypothetical protein